MPERGSTIRQWLAAAVTTSAVATTTFAQDRPDLVLRYDGLIGRETFKFKWNGVEHARAAGTLGWQFPSSSLATVGFDPAPKAFCLEPLVPVVAGQEYGFAVDSFGKPRDFDGVKDDKIGVEVSERRAKYVRELFVRHYAEVVKDEGTAAAFQVAVWELTSEGEIPVAPAGFSLYSGTFQSAQLFAQSPGFVQAAEGYLKGLTGDDSGFATTPLLAGRELVRLTGVNTITGEAAQSQLMVRNRGGVNNIVAPFGAEPSSFGGVGGLGQALAGLRSPALGAGGFGGGGGGVGGGGGIFGGIPGVVSPISPPPPPGTDNNPGGSNPIGPGSPPPPISPPPGVPPVPPVPPPPGVPPISPPPPGVPPVPPFPPIPPVPPVPPVPPPPESIPAPPGIILGGIAVGLIGLRKWLKKPKNGEPANS